MLDFEGMSDEQLKAIDIDTLDTDVNKSAFKKEMFRRHKNSFIEHIIKKHYPITIKGEKEELYLYEDGYYKPNGSSELKLLCEKEFGNANSGALYSEILYRIKSSNMVDRESFIEIPNKLNLKNGVLDIYSNKIEPHNPNFNFLYRIEREYNPDKYKECLLIKKFLMDICENDMDKYWLIIEYFGFILISEYKIKKFLCIFGDGDNGKTTLANLMTEFINEKNTSHLSMIQITEKEFLQANLYGKKLNIKGESIPTKISSMETLKSLTGDDYQEVNRKFKDTLKFKCTTKFVFHFNKLPEIDLTNVDEQGINRMLLLKLNHKFTKDEEDKNLLNKLTTENEMEGLLHLAIKGLERLRINKKFTYDDSKTHDLLIENQFNPISEFIEEKCELGDSKEHYTERYSLLKSYNNYNGNNKLSLYEFTRCISKYNVIIGKRGSVKKQKLCYVGIRLK